MALYGIDVVIDVVISSKELFSLPIIRESGAQYMYPESVRCPLLSCK